MDFGMLHTTGEQLGRWNVSLVVVVVEDVSFALR
jgi:hypothetical protein